MVWNGYAVLMFGKADSIKINNIMGCLSGNNFVCSEVFKLDFSSAFSFQLESLSLLHFALWCEYPAWFCNIFMNYGAELTVLLGCEGAGTVSPLPGASLECCTPRKSHRMPEMSAH
ncbi:hypothetical protein Tco_1100787 [Tanacetum coccineum]